MMETMPGSVFAWLKAHIHLIVPLVLACWMAWGDVRKRRIPNYLTLGTAVAGLGYQFGVYGWPGLVQGFLGLALGFGLLIGFYMKGGMGAGDVKALAALGAWLGPVSTLYLFIYMGLAGVPLIFFFLWRRGEIQAKFREWRSAISNWALLYRQSTAAADAATPASADGLPYAVALALGMFFLFWRGF